MDTALLGYYAGISTIVAMHLYFLLAPNNPLNLTMQGHSYIVLASAAAIIYWFVTKSGQV